MSIWFSIIIAGLINYLTRLVSVLAINPKKIASKIEQTKYEYIIVLLL